MKHFLCFKPKNNAIALFSLFVITNFFISCVDQGKFMNDHLNNPFSLELSEGFTYGGLKKIVDAQKIYFINNSEQDGSIIYEISLDYSLLAGSLVLSPNDVFLRAEPFVSLDFNGHIAATIDDSHIVALENGGSNIAVINIATKEIKKYSKPDNSLTQAGFNTDGVLYTAGGDSFYQVTNWDNEDGAVFNKLNHEGLPKITGGDLLFLDHKYRSKSFLSFSRVNDENGGDGAYLIDIIEGDKSGKSSKISFQKVFEVDANVTGACVAGINQLITTHENKSNANIYSSQGKKLFEIPIKTIDGEAFVAGKGDLTSVNNFDAEFFDEHITNGVIYLSSNEEGKAYELNLDNGDHKEIMKDIANSHIGVSDNTLFYTNGSNKIEHRGLYAWDMNSNKVELLRAGLLGEKVVVYNHHVLVMSGGQLRVLDITTEEIIHTQKFDEIGGGGDLLVSKDKKYLLVFDRTNKKIWRINLSDYSLNQKSYDMPVQEANGAAYNEDGTIIVSSKGQLYILDKNFKLIGQKLLGFKQNNGDMASTYFNY